MPQIAVSPKLNALREVGSMLKCKRQAMHDQAGRVAKRLGCRERDVDLAESGTLNNRVLLDKMVAGYPFRQAEIDQINSLITQAFNPAVKVDIMQHQLVTVVSQAARI